MAAISRCDGGGARASQRAFSRSDRSTRRYVFKTVGDAFCAAFAGAPEAIAAALGAQRALQRGRFLGGRRNRVRIALHSGYAQERDGDYFGPPLNRVARLVSVGHGGQTLISGTTAELLRDAVPPEGELRDLGAHRLKDLTRPERVYQLCMPDLLDTFPPLRSLDYLPNNLPQQPTSFVGRAGIVEEVKVMLHEHRLATLVGTGGAGKTRCAIQTGAELLDRYADGVWMIELTPLSDPDAGHDDDRAGARRARSPQRGAFDDAACRSRAATAALRSR